VAASGGKLWRLLERSMLGRLSVVDLLCVVFRGCWLRELIGLKVAYVFVLLLFFWFVVTVFTWFLVN
jgi:hypothetical protein